MTYAGNEEKMVLASVAEVNGKLVLETTAEMEGKPDTYTTQVMFKQHDPQSTQGMEAGPGSLTLSRSAIYRL